MFIGGDRETKVQSDEVSTSQAQESQACYQASSYVLETIPERKVLWQHNSPSTYHLLTMNCLEGQPVVSATLALSLNQRECQENIQPARRQYTMCSALTTAVICG